MPFSDRLVASTADAAWLPPGSTAEVWECDSAVSPEPAIIVRLLLTRVGSGGEPEIFCVEVAKGLDLPTRFLGGDNGWTAPTAGLEDLSQDIFGRVVPTYCVGYVRNVVPTPDETYQYPTPYAHVPVFAAGSAIEPIVPGEWVPLSKAHGELSARHWWPLAEWVLSSKGEELAPTTPETDDR
jgi:hypothetical protein